MCKEKVTERKELLYKGYLYDVTDFAKRHPGGNVINFYTEPGEDASQAIEQFHFRSKNKVDMMMKAFPRRPAVENEVNNSKMSSRHQELTKDFQKLYHELLVEGYFEPSYSQIFLRFLEPLAMGLVFLGIFFESESFLVKLLMTMPIGFTFSRFGWIAHEGGHRSLTGNRRIDGYLENVAMCFVLGGSSVWWNSEHNRHHAMPQRVNHDVDIQTLPYITWTEKEVEGPNAKKFNKFFVKYQGILYWTLDLFLFPIASKFYLHPKTQIRKRAYGEMILNIPSYFLMACVGLGWYALMAYFLSLFMAVSFALNHSFLEFADPGTHWVEYGLTHTANIKSSLLCDWWMGYLNFQIEHHLFPTIPQFKHKQITHRVKALAEKHGLPYMVYGYGQAMKLAMTHLHKVGHAVAG